MATLHAPLVTLTLTVPHVGKENTGCKGILGYMGESQRGGPYKTLAIYREGIYRKQRGPP